MYSAKVFFDDLLALFDVVFFFLTRFPDKKGHKILHVMYLVTTGNIVHFVKVGGLNNYRTCDFVSFGHLMFEVLHVLFLPHLPYLHVHFTINKTMAQRVWIHVDA